LHTGLIVEIRLVVVVLVYVLVVDVNVHVAVTPRFFFIRKWKRVGHSRQLHPSGRRGTLPVEHRLAVLEISQNHEAGGRGRQVFEGMST
jgi:hypothetical protein